MSRWCIGPAAAQHGVSKGFVVANPIDHSQPAGEGHEEHEEEEIWSDHQPLGKGFKAESLQSTVPGRRLLRSLTMGMIAVVMVVFKTKELSNRIMSVLVMMVPVVVAVIMTVVATTVRSTAIHKNAAQRTPPRNTPLHQEILGSYPAK